MLFFRNHLFPRAGKILLILLCSTLVAHRGAGNSAYPQRDLVLHLTVDSLAGDTSGSVLSSGWQDQSPALNHALPGVAPTYVADAGDGRPAVRFDGNDDFLRLDLELGNAVTVFLVYAAQRVPLPANREDILLAAVGSSSRLALASSRAQNPAPDYPTYGIVPSNDVEGTTWINGRSTREMTGDGFPGSFSIATAVFEQVPTTSTLVIGANDLSAAQAGRNDFREILIYNRALSAEERRAVERMLSLKHDIEAHTRPLADPLETYNLILGTQQFGDGGNFGGYSFGQSEIRILNAARQIYRQGGRVFKTRLFNRYHTEDGFSLRPGTNSLVSLAQHPEIREILDIPFRDFLFWTSSFSVPQWQDRARAVNVVPNANWINFYGADRALYAPDTYDDPAKAPSQFQGLDPAAAQNIYRELYDLTVHLLETYTDSGKNFYLGNWEGDWMLSQRSTFIDQNIPPHRLQAMIDWANVRQRAIDDAKAATPHQNVNVWFYLEMNSADWMRNNWICVLNTVVPALTKLDFISVSSYSIHKGNNGRNATVSRVHSDLKRIQDAISLKAGADEITGSRLIIGEYGFQRFTAFPTQELQARADITTVRQYLNWDGNLRFILIWQFYDDEIQASGSPEFSQIGPENARRPLYYFHENFYRHMRRWLEDRQVQDGVLPDAAAFKLEASHFLATVSLTEYRPVAPFTRYDEWKNFNFPDHLDRQNPAISGPQVAPSPAETPNLLRYALGFNRRDLSPSLPYSIEREGDDLNFNFPFFPTQTDIIMRVEQSADLLSWDQTLFDSRNHSLTPQDGRLAVPFQTSPNQPIFLRLRVDPLP